MDNFMDSSSWNIGRWVDADYLVNVDMMECDKKWDFIDEITEENF